MIIMQGEPSLVASGVLSLSYCKILALINTAFGFELPY